MIVTTDPTEHGFRVAQNGLEHYEAKIRLTQAKLDYARDVLAYIVASSNPAYHRNIAKKALKRL